MSGFDASWLDLREPADHRSRSEELAQMLARHLGRRGQTSIVDMGCGTGSNLRATAPLLGAEQHWTLVDYDPRLLDAAVERLSAWASQAEHKNNQLVLSKGGKRITVRLRRADLARDLERVFTVKPDLVTASALFDLVSVPFLRTLAHAIAARRASFYSVLTYNGVHRWTPRRPDDNRVSSAFHRHQLRDKGFGPALGPVAGVHLAEQFSLEGYSVIEGESIWRLTRNDRQLLEELVRGHAIAAADTGLVDCKTIEAWVKVPRTGADVGHTDIFAAPA